LGRTQLTAFLTNQAPRTGRVAGYSAPRGVSFRTAMTSSQRRQCCSRAPQSAPKSWFTSLRQWNSTWSSKKVAGSISTHSDASFQATLRIAFEPSSPRLLRVRKLRCLHVIPLLSQPGNHSGKLQLQTVQFAGIRSRDIELASGLDQPRGILDDRDGGVRPVCPMRGRRDQAPAEGMLTKEHLNGFLRQVAIDLSRSVGAKA